MNKNTENKVVSEFDVKTNSGPFSSTLYDCSLTINSQIYRKGDRKMQFTLVEQH